MTITENDAPVLSIADVSLEEAAANMTFTVKWTGKRQFGNGDVCDRGWHSDSRGRLHSSLGRHADVRGRGRPARPSRCRFLRTI